MQPTNCASRPVATFGNGRDLRWLTAIRTWPPGTSVSLRAAQGQDGQRGVRSARSSAATASRPDRLEQEGSSLALGEAGLAPADSGAALAMGSLLPNLSLRDLFALSHVA